MSTPATTATNTVSKPDPMCVAHYTVSFLTPAFLGDANQDARWRTPPFKHLLREWWRVAWWARHRGKASRTVAQMRHAEGLLFGHAWLSDDELQEHGRSRKVAARQSQVRLRLQHVDDGGDAKQAWQGESRVGVSPIRAGDIATGYAWFGLANRGRGERDRQRLETGQKRMLALAVPESHYAEVCEAMALIHAFGTLGTRSRGGWGSLQVEASAFPKLEISRCCEPLDDCLARDWAAAIAWDAKKGPWLWTSSESFKTWDRAIATAAGYRRQIRTALKGPPNLRPILGFASPGRMPSPLRWKVVRNGQHLRLQVVAMPHRIPDGGPRIDRKLLLGAWQTIGETLDNGMGKAFKR